MMTVAAAPYEEDSTPTREVPGLSLLRLIPLTSEDDEQGEWRATRAHSDETFRWERGPREWISIAVGRGDELGLVIVRDHRGQRESYDSFEGALAVVASWKL